MTYSTIPSQLADLHRQDLLEQAELSRRARSFRSELRHRRSPRRRFGH